MSGFRTPEQPRGQSVLWAHRLEDAIPQDHPVRLLDYLLHSEAFADTFAAWTGPPAADWRVSRRITLGTFRLSICTG